MRTILITVLLVIIAAQVKSQTHFPEQCEGLWNGKMYIYAGGKLRDSVEAKLTVKKSTDSTWTWKTEYFSKKAPIVKDYVIKLKAKENFAEYILDEGDGIQLESYLVGSKLYNIFAVQGQTLMSYYELRDNKLIFEILSSKESDTKQEVTNYKLQFLQRTVFTKEAED